MLVIKIVLGSLVKSLKLMDVNLPLGTKTLNIMVVKLIGFTVLHHANNSSKTDELIIFMAHKCVKLQCVPSMHLVSEQNRKVSGSPIKSSESHH